MRSGRAWTYFLRARSGPGLIIQFAGRVCTTAAGPGRAYASNHICGPGLGLNFRPAQALSGTMMPTMCQLLVVTQLNLKKSFACVWMSMCARGHVAIFKKKVFWYYLRCFTDMALHSRGGCYATTRRLQHYGRPYQPQHNPTLLYYFAVPPQLTVLASSNGSITSVSVENLVSTWTVFCKANIITETSHIIFLKVQK